MPGPKHSKANLRAFRQTMRANRAQQQGRLRNQSRRQIKLQKLNAYTERLLQASKQELLNSHRERWGAKNTISPEDFVDWVEKIAPQVTITPEVLVSQARSGYTAGRFSGGISIMKIINVLLLIASIATVKVDALASPAQEAEYARALRQAVPSDCWYPECMEAAQAPVREVRERMCIAMEGGPFCPASVWATVQPQIKAAKEAKEKKEAQEKWDREAPQREAAAAKKAAEDKKIKNAENAAAAKLAEQAERLAKTKEFAQTWAPAGAVALGVGGLTAAAAAEYKRRAAAANSNHALGKVNANNTEADGAIEKAKAELNKAKRASGLGLRF
jgi:hypothetical protein